MAYFWQSRIVDAKNQLNWEQLASLIPFGSAMIADNSITSAKIVDGTIATADIGALQITNGLLAADAVTTGKILDGTIATTDEAVFPNASAYRSSNTSINDATWTALSFNAEDWDLGTPSNNMFTASSAVITARVAGLYMIVGNVCFDANATGERGARLKHSANGMFAIVETGTSGGTNFTQVNITGLQHFTVGQTVQMEVFQSSGGGLNAISTGASSVSNLSMAWITN